MNIIVNGKNKAVTDGITAQQLLEKLDLTEHKCAMEVNEVIIPCSEYMRYILQVGDNVEIIHAIGGG